MNTTRSIIYVTMLLYFCGWANLAYSQNPVEPKPDPGLRITKVDATENDKVSAEFDSLMNRINTMRQMPEYMLDREFKGLFIEGPTKILEKARALIDRAERDGTQTPERRGSLTRPITERLSRYQKKKCSNCLARRSLRAK
jgi:hypothetical protein